MISRFHTKHVRSILDMQRARYEYILLRIGIEPEVKTSGRGSSNIFSFKNLIEFGICNLSCNVGFIPKMARVILERVNNHSDKLPIFNRAMNKNIYFNIVWNKETIYTSFTGDDIGRLLQRPQYYIFRPPIIDCKLENCEQYTVFNLTTVKRNILNKINQLGLGDNIG